MKKEMFGIWDWKGFHITFENGVDVSVQFGFASYSDNYDKFDLFNQWENEKKVEFDKLLIKYKSIEHQNITSTTAEIGIMRNGRFITNQYLKQFDPENNSVVIGYVTSDELVDILIWAKNKRFGSRYGSNPVKY